MRIRPPLRIGAALATLHRDWGKTCPFLQTIGGGGFDWAIFYPRRLKKPPGAAGMGLPELDLHQFGRLLLLLFLDVPVQVVEHVLGIRLVLWFFL